jgi:hypothetical protein
MLCGRFRNEQHQLATRKMLPNQFRDEHGILSTVIVGSSKSNGGVGSCSG